MQQTETLKLNLIEGTDTVDPAPINENMETLETETQAIRTEMTSATTALTTSLTSLAADLGSGEKNCRIAWGSYAGDRTCTSAYPTTLTFDFTPVLIICFSATNGYEEFHMLRPSVKAAGINNQDITVSWTENGVSWYASSTSDQYNVDQAYVYVAFGT